MGSGLIFSGVVSFRQAGVCFGKCEENRRAEFDRIFPDWIAREAECGPRGEEDRMLIAALYPDLLSDIDARNQSFAALSVKEQSDALSLGDRNEYLDDPWRVVLMAEKDLEQWDILLGVSEELSYNEFPTLVRECPHDGLVGASYCEGLVSVGLKTVSGGFFSSGTVPFNQRVYTHLHQTGRIEEFIAEMEANSARDFEQRRSAEAQIQAMPATEFPLESDPFYELTVKNRVEQIYLAGKCQP